MIREVVLTRINLVLLAVLAAVTAYAFFAIPAGAVIPTHWGPDGRADAFAERTQAFLMSPAIAVAMLVLISVVVRFAGREQVEAGKSGLAVVITALLVLFITVQTGMLLIGLGVAVNMVQLVAFGLALLLVLAGNVMPKTQPNRLAGIRLSWVLADSQNWRATHRLVGLLMMAAGVLLAVLALLPVHPLVLFAGILVAVLSPILVGVVYSYRLSKRA